MNKANLVLLLRLVMESGCPPGEVIGDLRANLDVLEGLGYPFEHDYRSQVEVHNRVCAEFVQAYRKRCDEIVQAHTTAILDSAANRTEAVAQARAAAAERIREAEQQSFLERINVKAYACQLEEKANGSAALQYERACHKADIAKDTAMAHAREVMEAELASAVAEFDQVLEELVTNFPKRG
jgi:hypothetical protein